MPKTILLAIVSILLVGSIILQPDESFKASLQGLTIWWNIVFPGLLPFLVLYEIMLAFGLAHAIGNLLQPMMKRMTGLPGEAALAVVFGWLGGYPAGSEAVTSLRKREVLNRSQSQQLLGIAHMPNPIFMLVVIGAGFLHKPIAGMMIAAAVWVSALWLLLLSYLFRDRKQPAASSSDITPAPLPSESGQRKGALSAIAQGLQSGREEDGRSFGKVLGDSVANSVQKLMIVGGLMIFAAVLSKLSEPLLIPILKQGFSFIGPAFFESHLGAYAAAVWDAPGASAAFGSAIIAAVLAWSGMAGILQTGYAISGTDLKLLPFIAFRLNHALHAFLLTLLLWQPMTWLIGKLNPNGDFPVMLYGHYFAASLDVNMPIQSVTASELPSLWPISLTAAGLLMVILLLTSFISGSKNGRISRFR
ncbi:nucleoside recognition domain-containing protein [Paenibacillus nanensis]|nr:nucleoside recognition domain-containing protein [Paenibacillus nanensis]